MTTAWTADDVREIGRMPAAAAPPISEAVRPIGGESRYYWDMWPIQDEARRMVPLGGRELWMALAAPDRGDPALRHFEAKIRWLERQGSTWVDRGEVLPDVPVPYEREWAGSTLLRNDCLTLFFTGAGLAVRPGGYQQALFSSSALVDRDGRPGAWTRPRSLIGEIGGWYAAADEQRGEPGKIKAFRDPAYFRDPSDGAEYLAFTATLASGDSEYSGAFGLARHMENGWRLLPPLISAKGVNSELERAHLIAHAGRYYAFWVTQKHTFAPALRHAPTGLYGMVADRLSGPYRPINGDSLVLAASGGEAGDTYSWFVSADGIVSSFIDKWSPAKPETAASNSDFVGVPAPLLRLAFGGDGIQFGPSSSAPNARV